jgi:hypothetical protein
MHIVAIAWIYVVFMMAITEQSVVAGVATFFLYGVFPLSIILYLMKSPERRRKRLAAEKNAAAMRAEKQRAAQIVQPQGEPLIDFKTDAIKRD